MFIIKVFFLTGWIYSHNASWALQFSSPVVMIFTTLNLFYFRMLPHKFQLQFEFWKIPTNVQSVLVIPSYLPLEQDKLPLPINGLCQVWLKLAKWLRRRSQMCKKYTDRQKDRRTKGRTDWHADAGQKVIRNAHLSFKLR